jgi:hypothetical protein
MKAARTRFKDKKGEAEKWREKKKFIVSNYFISVNDFHFKRSDSCFSINLLKDYYKKSDQGHPSFFHENHPKEKYHYRRANVQDPLCTDVLIFFEYNVLRKNLVSTRSL